MPSNDRPAASRRGVWRKAACRRRSWLRRLIRSLCRGPLAWAPPPALGARGTIAAMFSLIVFDHFAARGMVGVCQVHPPLRLHTVHLTRLGAQLQEVHCRPEPWLFDH